MLGKSTNTLVVETSPHLWLRPKLSSCPSHVLCSWSGELTSRTNALSCPSSPWRISSSPEPLMLDRLNFPKELWIPSVSNLCSQDTLQADQIYTSAISIGSAAGREARDAQGHRMLPRAACADTVGRYMDARRCCHQSQSMIPPDYQLNSPGHPASWHGKVISPVNLTDFEEGTPEPNYPPHPLLASSLRDRRRGTGVSQREPAPTERQDVCTGIGPIEPIDGGGARHRLEPRLSPSHRETASSPHGTAKRPPGRRAYRTTNPPSWGAEQSIGGPTRSTTKSTNGRRIASRRERAQAGRGAERERIHPLPPT